jgi:hypothetical protein
MGMGMGMVGAVGSPGDRIQLAPLRSGEPVASIRSGEPLGSLRGGESPAGPYSVIQIRSSSRDAYGLGVSSLREEGREEDRGAGSSTGGSVGGREREESPRGRERGKRGEKGKKNPLSIGSIISDETV